MPHNCEISFNTGFSVAAHMPSPHSPRSARGKSTKIDDKDSTQQTLKILVAEDDNISRLFLSRVLSKFGHSVTSVKSGKEVLKALQTADVFDVLLTDIQMPEIDGMELTQIVRSDSRYRAHACLPIIAMTAYTSTGDREKYLTAGMDEYLPKPIDGKLLAIMLENFSVKQS
ncbi:response regulator [Desulfosediminicola flagellatus]|uniref:response regulator n=1 Tax=Desulfosediminicola flagellatus TaxID=2569541 RepID=UPI0010ACF13B|nr:response regulator [Desulfosediminicola flagellatus]